MYEQKIMMDKFDILNTVGIKRDEALRLAVGSEKDRSFEGQIGNISVGLSSGTSGAQGLFITSRKERNMWTGAMLAKFSDLLIYNPLRPTNKPRIAFFLRANNNLYESLGKSKAVSFKYFDPLKNMEQNLEELKSYNPTILVAPPSILIQLADMLDNTNNDWGHENFESRENIKCIISVAEVLTRMDKVRIAQTFKAPIRQIYQCTEGFLGYTCKYGGFHLNEDVVYIERHYIDKASKRFIPVITDFTRTSQPIIRYRLNDVLVGYKRCRCGSCLATIQEIEGREDDIFKFISNRGDNKPVVVFPDFISRCIIYTGSGIHNYRVIQHSYMDIEVQIDNDSKEIHEAVENEFKRLSTYMGFIMPRIVFREYVKESNRKLKRVEQKMI